MTKSQVIEQLFTGKNFNECLSKMEPFHLQEDLKMEVIAAVCEWPEEKILGLNREGRLEYYVVRVIVNMVSNKYSQFHKKFRTTFIELKDQDRADDMVDNVARAAREAAEETLIGEIESGSNNNAWYPNELLRLYMELGSYRAIEQVTQIPYISCYKSIQEYIKKLRTKAEKIEAKPIFSKKERSFIQNS